MEKDLKRLSTLLEKVEEFITHDSDATWCSFNSPIEIRTVLKDHREKLLQENIRSLNELKLLFAPTGSLQEHSLSNGWAEEYIKLSSEFDKICSSIESKKNIKRLVHRIRQTANSILEFFFPSLCITCNARLHESEKHICLSCINSLPRTNYHNQSENRLEEYLGGRFIFGRAGAFCYFYKTGSLQKIVHEFKYRNNPELARYIGRLYGNDLRNTDFIKDIDYLIPVPLHPKRRKQRGYNQAEEICKGISESTGIPVCITAIERTVNNPSQTKKNKEERLRNTEGIFTVTNLPHLKGKNILLVDDVITTGSTIESIAKSFSEHEAPGINVTVIGMAI